MEIPLAREELKVKNIHRKNGLVYIQDNPKGPQIHSVVIWLFPHQFRSHI
jgi:hypothetical protein